MVDIKRFSRQLLLPEVGADGQKKLESSKVLIVGAGGLGSPNAFYLAAAGVGRIGLIDGDIVDVSNLNRQIMHVENSVGTPKVHSAAARIQALNPNVRLDLYEDWFTHENAEDVVKDYDVIVDAVDNFPIKYIINDACVLQKKPFVHAGVVGWKGQVLVHEPESACLRCLVPEPTPTELAPTCSRSGILGAMAGIVGCAQALETIKLILGARVSTNRVLFFDGLRSKHTSVKLERDCLCPICGMDPTITRVEQVQMPACDLKGHQ